MHGDLLRVERRVLVDGIVNTTTAEGSFAGVQQVGSSELIVLRGEDGAVRLIPLANVSEITLVKAVQREAPPSHPAAPKAPAWDPGVA